MIFRFNENDAVRINAIRFFDERRACFIACKLAAMGHGVYWDPDVDPLVVVSNLDEVDFHEFQRVHQGFIQDWKSIGKIYRNGGRYGNWIN